MQTKKYTNGQVIYRAGDPVEHISLITEGEVEGSRSGHSYALSQSDVMGLSDLKRGNYTYTFTALSDVVLCQYPCENVDALDALVHGNPDVSYLMVTFMCRHVAELLDYIAQLKSEAKSALSLTDEIYDEYCRLCALYNTAKGKLPEKPEAELPQSDDEAASARKYDFYTEIKNLGPDVRKAFFRGNPGIVSGFLHICIEDITAIYQLYKASINYLRSVSSALLHGEGNDLFALITQLHIDLADNEGADFAIDALVVSLSEELSKLADLSAIRSAYYQTRLEAYWDALEDKRETPTDILDIFNEESASPEDEPSEEKALPASDDSQSAPVPQSLDSQSIPDLKDSLQKILDYAEADKSLADMFSRCVRDFAELPDRNSPEDDVSDLRRELTKVYYNVYRLVFIKSLEDPAPPTVINMFLNFGYVDASLAGYDNANFLYGITDSFKGDPEKGVYTLREWLTSIYLGAHEPSLSEFDMDYAAYVRDLKNSKQIDAAGEKRMLADKLAKLNYEMDNAFPVVNRVTYGNPSKFCPVFSDHNIVRALKDTLVTPADISAIIEEIRSIDFSAFYRQTAYSNQKLGVTNEQIHVEVLPNIILMPNVGLRGSMWQDVEGRVRTTPARMFLPAFLENDLKPLLIRLVGEFRWEICRRIQGSRWNDMTDPSLTSYFCDYLQFYMNNRSISMQTMTEIRNEVSAARNNYKAVFISNYVTWLQNESRGMARLNSVALGILMTFCPFSAKIRENLKTFMRYNEALSKYNVRQQKRVLRLTNLVKKLSQSGKPLPQELVDELEFWKK